MFMVGLGLVGLVVQYGRKPVWNEGIPINEFIADDRRRRRSAKVVYDGGGWRTTADRAGLYVLTWIEETHEICAVRSPLLPSWLRLAPESAFSFNLLGDGETIHLLGWADNREALDPALAGWERHMDEPDSLAWAQERLDLAAAAGHQAGAVQGQRPLDRGQDRDAGRWTVSRWTVSRWTASR